MLTIISFVTKVITFFILPLLFGSSNHASAAFAAAPPHGNNICDNKNDNRNHNKRITTKSHNIIPFRHHHRNIIIIGQQHHVTATGTGHAQNEHDAQIFFALRQLRGGAGESGGDSIINNILKGTKFPPLPPPMLVLIKVFPIIAWTISGIVGFIQDVKNHNKPLPLILLKQSSLFGLIYWYSIFRVVPKSILKRFVNNPIHYICTILMFLPMILLTEFGDLIDFEGGREKDLGLSLVGYSFNWLYVGISMLFIKDGLDNPRGQLCHTMFANILSILLLYVNCFPGGKRGDLLPDLVIFAPFYPFLIWFIQSCIIPFINTKSLGICFNLLGVWLFTK